MSTANAPTDISSSDGSRITAEAATWKGTPYSLVGAASTKGTTGGGDCSGSTFKIYQAAGFAFEYHSAGQFPAYALSSGHFRELNTGEAKQDGDILSWSDHMAIYSTFMSAAETKDKTTNRTNKQGHGWIQNNDMWTATHTGGGPYHPGALIYSGKPTAPRVFRWIVQE
jgi:cell wall-associated NlpC family hydrolase